MENWGYVLIFFEKNRFYLHRTWKLTRFEGKLDFDLSDNVD